ncbi:hypothetical protein TYRP_013778 [Tyrophagus putrescentiae]|nr:hypothetical protein TYRP_013778 [Tyrophagus putrescentiae]
MNTSSSASKKVFPITSQVYENVGKAAKAKANDSKPFFGGKKLSTGTRLKLRTLEMAENLVLEILQGEPKNSSGQQQQQPPLKIVEKLELMEDFIDQLPPYHWMQAKEWTKRLLTLWRLFGRSVYVQVAQGGPLAAAAKEGGGDNSRGGVAQKKNGPKTEATSSSSYADRRAAALHSSPVAKLRKLHFLEETIIKILRCNNNNSILLSSVEEYLRKSEEVVRQLPLTLRPEEWTKRVAQLRAEYHAKDVAEKEKRGELSPLEQQLTSIRVFLEGVFPGELLVFDLLPDITTVGRIKQWVAELLTGGGEDDETEETEKEEEDIVAPKTPKTTTTTTKKHLLGYEGKE